MRAILSGGSGCGQFQRLYNKRPVLIIKVGHHAQALLNREPNVFLNARSVYFGRDTGPLVKQSREMTLILKTYT